MRKILTDLFTGPDGETWAIGRIYSIPVLVSGLVLPFVMMCKGQPINLQDMALYFPGLGGAVMALVLGTNPTEPKAKDGAQ